MNFNKFLLFSILTTLSQTWEISFQDNNVNYMKCYEINNENYPNEQLEFYLNITRNHIEYLPIAVGFIYEGNFTSDQPIDMIYSINSYMTKTITEIYESYSVCVSPLFNSTGFEYEIGVFSTTTTTTSSENNNGIYGIIFIIFGSIITISIVLMCFCMKKQQQQQYVEI